MVRRVPLILCRCAVPLARTRPCWLISPGNKLTLSPLPRAQVHGIRADHDDDRHEGRAAGEPAARAVEAPPRVGRAHGGWDGGERARSAAGGPRACGPGPGVLGQVGAELGRPRAAQRRQLDPTRLGPSLPFSLSRRPPTSSALPAHLDDPLARQHPLLAPSTSRPPELSRLANGERSGSTASRAAQSALSVPRRGGSCAGRHPFSRARRAAGGVATASAVRGWAEGEASTWRSRLGASLPQTPFSRARPDKGLTPNHARAQAARSNSCAEGDREAELRDEEEKLESVAGSSRMQLLDRFLVSRARSESTERCCMRKATKDVQEALARS